MTTRTRFAPSPTGYLHIGGARTALYAWLEARRKNGQFILRIEDTDRERSTQEAVDAILEGMAWLGLQADEEPLYQSKRFDRYREVMQSLLDEGKAYRCYCSRERLDDLREKAMAEGKKPRYDGHCRDGGKVVDGVTPVIRFKNPDTGSVVFNDLVRGRIEWQNEELDDLIIWRSDDTPTYNFVVVVDDLDMGITEVIRGDDHINNTPRQINIYRALGKEPPHFAHLPMIHGADGAKLSKRHGAVSVMQYRDEGYLPHALVNYLVRLGWSHGDQEVFSLDELIELFDVANVNRSAARFDADKLAWLNQQYLKNDPAEETAKHLDWHMQQRGYDLSKGPTLTEVVSALADRCKTLVEMAEMARPWYVDELIFNEKAVAKHLVGGEKVLLSMKEKLSNITDWSVKSLHDVVQSVAKELDLGMGKVAQPLRVAMTGNTVSPSIDLTIALCGKHKAMSRIDHALTLTKPQDDD